MPISKESVEAFGEKDEDSEKHRPVRKGQKLTWDQVFEIRRRMKVGEFESYAACSREYGVSRWMVAKICHGTRRSMIRKTAFDRLNNE